MELADVEDHRAVSRKKRWKSSAGLRDEELTDGRDTSIRSMNALRSSGL
jgi:hypothetical protein